MTQDTPRPPAGDRMDSEGGLRAPPGLSFWGKAWWWFHFLILVKLARLRFIAILVIIGLVLVKWSTLVAYYERWTRPAPTEHAAAGDFEYFCPMHPAIVRDNPHEKCPICFMPLSKRKLGTPPEPLPAGVVNRVQLSPYRVVLAGVQTWRVAHVPLTKEIVTVGFIEFNERGMKTVSARVKGRLDQLFVNETGQLVHAAAPLASLYSPELIVTAQNLLDARRSSNMQLLEVSRNRLELWGIQKDQIDDILRTGKTPTHLTIRSPMDGHVLKKYVKEGQYVEEGSPLYDVVDLSTVWVQGQVYEDDMSFLPVHAGSHPGSEEKQTLPVQATTRAFPNEIFTGNLTFVYPHVDQETRTVVVRIELPNPEHKLRPGTSATVTIRIPPAKQALLQATLANAWAKEAAIDLLGRALAAPGATAAFAGLAPALTATVEAALLQRGLLLAVPETAVIDTGTQKVVYRETLPGEYEGVQVTLGPRMVGPENVRYYPVLGGLAAGERVVTSGSFLIDAETRLNPAVGSTYFGSSGSSGAKASSAVRPSTPTDPEIKIQVALAQLSEADRRLAQQQLFCPIQTDKKLGSMDVPVKLMIEGQPVFLCCKGCQSDALANPKETLARVEKLKKAHK